MTIGGRIKSARIAAGYTLEELSTKMGLSRQTLSRYETGVIGNIPSDKIEVLAKVLNTTPSYIMGWSQKDPVVTNDGIDIELQQLFANIDRTDQEFVKDWMKTRSKKL